MTAETNTPREVVARAMDALEPAYQLAFYEWMRGDEDNGPPPQKPTTLDRADAALAALAQAAGLAEVLRGHRLGSLIAYNMRHRAYFVCACGWWPTPAVAATVALDEFAAHLADVVRAWIGGGA